MRAPPIPTVCLGKRIIAPQVYEVRLRKPDGFAFRAGQFVLFDVPAPGDAADVQTRAYSIASAPGEDDLLFVIKLVHGGRASRWVAEDVGSGTAFLMRGPFGAFTLDAVTRRPYLFLATGTGVAPILSHLRSALSERHDMRRMDLVFGVRAPEDLFWEGEWRMLERVFPNLRVHASFLMGGENWHGERGTLEEIAERIPDRADRSIYICGAPAMVRAVKALCASWGVPPADIHSEQYV